MKKTGLTILMAALICTVSFANDSHNADKQKATFMAKQDFQSDFPNIKTVQWRRDQQYSEAIFTKDGTLMHAFYDWDGQLAGTTHDVRYSDLPESARKTIAKQYKDYTIERTIVYNDREENLNDLFPLVPYESNINYFVSLKRNDQREPLILQVKPDGEVSFFEMMK
ncbi:hypothetical protein [Agriterribacter humi]|uniref:hypothetical protein n=1 Tax=Agriterribacter humi TaxID=1104781 RepID=UPI0012647035|nr:hypothetical protein [Agriterribacter humi]